MYGLLTTISIDLSRIANALEAMNARAIEDRELAASSSFTPPPPSPNPDPLLPRRHDDDEIPF